MLTDCLGLQGKQYGQKMSGMNQSLSDWAYLSNISSHGGVNYQFWICELYSIQDSSLFFTKAKVLCDQ